MRRGELMQMTLGEIPLDEMKEVWYGEGYEEGEAKGISQGMTKEKDLRIRRYLMLHHNPQEAATLFEMPLDNVLAISKELGK